MGFIDSFKSLEKLCGEIYSTNHGISAYIEEMIRLSDGPLLIPSWDEDLKQLKHYRWTRNKIAHEPGCTEETMCKPEDAKWLDDFHSRIIESKDPLSLYYKAKTPKKAKATKKADSNKPGFITILFSFFLILLALALVLTFISLLIK